MEKLQFLKIGNVNAIVCKDKNSFTIMNLSDGGAIITEKSFLKAKKKFVKATTLAVNIRKFLHFKQYGISPS